MRVYHFFNKEHGLEALQNERLKISRIKDLNDPFELLGVDISNRNVRKAFLEMKSDFGENRGLICFSKGWKNPVLWSHYADRFRGLCLGFDVPNELLMEVTYAKKRKNPENWIYSSIQSVQDEGMQEVLTTKFSHWNYEEEMRLFVGLDDVDTASGHYFLEFSDNLMIKEIFVGLEASITRDEIEGALGKNNAHIERFRTRAAFKKFEVEKN